MDHSGILSGPVDGPARITALYPQVAAERGLLVLHRGSRFRGQVARIEGDAVALRSPASGDERLFRMAPGAFAINGETVTLVRPTVGHAAPATTPSGSRAASTTKAKVARAGRIFVEGVHDAELVEKVWGDDLRYEGIVVERLDGIDDLPAEVTRFGPATDARLGVLVDHLVPGSKESRIAAQIGSPFVLVTGTPYVDIWQGIRPHVAGIERWPDVPRDRPWKEGVCRALGTDDPGRLWKQLLASVKGYADLEPELVGAVESLIDFVTGSD